MVKRPYFQKKSGVSPLKASEKNKRWLSVFFLFLFFILMFNLPKSCKHLNTVKYKTMYDFKLDNNYYK